MAEFESMPELLEYATPVHYALNDACVRKSLKCWFRLCQLYQGIIAGSLQQCGNPKKIDRIRRKGEGRERERDQRIGEDEREIDGRAPARRSGKSGRRAVAVAVEAKPRTTSCCRRADESGGAAAELQCSGELGDRPAGGAVTAERQRGGQRLTATRRPWEVTRAQLSRRPVRTVVRQHQRLQRQRLGEQLANGGQRGGDNACSGGRQGSGAVAAATR
ncbi:hypothetical protein Scep_021066 [Stephania cephalantha]|uniref:Uncharacterized protein n=1 Tax=Stephania cephalantha TaxID=152367 RepID=A0AAP0F8B9_9MAGN